ncbi:hypothetical protein ACHAPJ_005249 [Fusarium lateritium]
MSGVELLSLISSIITVLDASVKIYQAAEDASGLPSVFRDIASRLPLIHESLSLAKDGLKQHPPPMQSSTALRTLLETCNKRVTRLHSIFQMIIPPPRASRAPRYLKALKAISYADAMKSLMEEITADIQVITLNHVVKAATREQIDELVHELRGPRVTEGDLSLVLHNIGLGNQYVHRGVGDQNIVSSTATQINGMSYGCTFNIVQS